MIRDHTDYLRLSIVIRDWSGLEGLSGIVRGIPDGLWGIRDHRDGKLIMAMPITGNLGNWLVVTNLGKGGGFL